MKRQEIKERNEEIKRLFNSGKTNKEIALIFNLHKTHVSRITSPLTNKDEYEREIERQVREMIGKRFTVSETARRLGVGVEKIRNVCSRIWETKEDMINEQNEVFRNIHSNARTIKEICEITNLGKRKVTQLCTDLGLRMDRRKKEIRDNEEKFKSYFLGGATCKEIREEFKCSDFTIYHTARRMGIKRDICGNGRKRKDPYPITHKYKNVLSMKW